MAAVFVSHERADFDASQIALAQKLASLLQSNASQIGSQTRPRSCFESPRETACAQGRTFSKCVQRKILREILMQIGLQCRNAFVVVGVARRLGEQSRLQGGASLVGKLSGNLTGNVFTEEMRHEV